MVLRLKLPRASTTHPIPMACRSSLSFEVSWWKILCGVVSSSVNASIICLTLCFGTFVVLTMIFMVCSES